jgi:hypothetical protein
VTTDAAALVRRTLAELVTARSGADLTTGLDAFGWVDLFDDDPGLAVQGLFAAQGRQGKWSPAFNDAAGRTLPGGSVGRDVVLPRPRRASSASRDGDELLVDGLVLGPRPRNDTYVLLLGDRDVDEVVEVRASCLRVVVRAGLSDQLGTVEVTGCVGQADRLLRDAETARAWWGDTQATLRLALCSYIAGGLRTMFDLAGDHAREREQFGRRVGTFQAVRHKLAEAYVAVEALDAACAAAWDVRERALTAATTKLVASRSMSTVAAHAQQVLAGVGFTAEHPFHRVLKPVVMCDRLLGSAPELAIEVGRCMVERGGAPRLVEL